MKLNLDRTVALYSAATVRLLRRVKVDYRDSADTSAAWTMYSMLGGITAPLRQALWERGGQ